VKPAVTRLLERYAGRYMIFVLLLTACVWFISGSTVGMLAVLVASCPCALVLAAPATAIAAIAVASRHGILVKGAAFLEQLATVDAVVFDKTGTLTLGQLRLVGTAAQPGISASALIKLAASLGAASSHPVSRALSSQIPESDRLSVSDLKETRGLGIVGKNRRQTRWPGPCTIVQRPRRPGTAAARPYRANRRGVLRHQHSGVGYCSPMN